MPQAARWGSKVASRVATAVPREEAASATLISGEACAGGWLLDESVRGRELLPGFVHLPRLIPPASQQALLELAFSVAGESRTQGQSGGWYRQEADEKWSLNDGTKARFWDSISRFPTGFRELGIALAKLAARDSAELRGPADAFDPRVGALNYYTSTGRMGWHADDYNFAKKERPIVMANLGDAGDFGFKLRKNDPDQSVRLNSGDVIVFGGRARDLVHAMLRVHPDTAPSEIRAPGAVGARVGRTSITWRDVGPEDGLTFNSDERLGLTVTENTLPKYLPKRGGASRGAACRGCKASSTVDGQYCQKCWDAWGPQQQR
ncbi:unnamed protein product [Polarella glacialis]|uniref:Fe2OG dioxygenase domain-containing protein n=1 Tax=Polarella glacialis TaxID=89957 RepID=A0A813JGE8_POLGL|nr:unnamed protein product [Polarella glacialis]